MTKALSEVKKNKKIISPTSPSTTTTGERDFVSKLLKKEQKKTSKSAPSELVMTTLKMNSKVATEGLIQLIRKLQGVQQEIDRKLHMKMNELLCFSDELKYY